MSTAFTEHVDVLIAGGGLTGDVSARTIAGARRDATVLVVEASPVATQPPGNRVANIALSASAQRSLTRTALCKRPEQQGLGNSQVYVAGNGVTPASAACNPNLNSVALAIGGSVRNHLATRWSSRISRS